MAITANLHVYPETPISVEVFQKSEGLSRDFATLKIGEVTIFLFNQNDCEDLRRALHACEGFFEDLRYRAPETLPLDEKDYHYANRL